MLRFRLVTVSSSWKTSENVIRRAIYALFGKAPHMPTDERLLLNRAGLQQWAVSLFHACAAVSPN